MFRKYWCVLLGINILQIPNNSKISDVILNLDLFVLFYTHFDLD